jgi:glutathione S-transferase
MIELIQFPWSSFCLVQKKILEYSGVKFRIINIPPTDRKLVWKITKQRYYKVPVIKDGNVVVFETSDESQVIAKYVDSKLKLNLFPRPLDGVQSIIWRFIETEVENITFKLNDIYYEEFVPEKYRLDFIRFKERKYGTGCIQNWRINQIQLVRDLIKALLPFERMVTYRDYLLCEQPVFVDFDLLGMIENFLFSGHYHFPNELPNLADWYNRLKSLRYGTLTNEK